MAETPAELIEEGARHLLKVLSEASPIKYSRFYDGKSETSDALAVALGLEEDDDYCAEHIIDLAVYELSEQGIVETLELPDLLLDETNDYQIALTEKGRQLGATTETLKFWDAE